MDELPGIDPRLAAALRRHADLAVRPRDAMAISRSARAAVVAIPDRRGQRLLAIAVAIGLLLAFVLAVMATVGQRPGPSAAFAPGSIAYTRGGDLYVATADGQGARLLASVDTTGGDAIGYFSFAPDLRSLAYEIQNDSGTINETQIVDSDGGPVGTFPDLMKHASWAPDGRSLAVFYFDRGPSIVGLDGTTLRVLRRPDIAYDLFGSRRVAWSPDGRWIAVSACRDVPASSSCKFDHGWLLIAADGSGSHWLGEPTGPYDMGRLAWAADTRVVLSGLLDPTSSTAGVQVLSPDTGLLQEIDVPLRTADQTWWAPDSSRLLVEGGSNDNATVARLVVVDSAGASTVLTTDPVVLDGPAGWSGDGQRVIFAGSVGAGSHDTPRGATTQASAHGLWSIDARGGAPKPLIGDADPAWFAVASFPLGRFPQ